MKISNREKIMLYILGIILVGLGYYNSIYSYQSAKIQEKLKAESDIEQKYTTAKATIDSLEDKKSSVKVLKAKIEDESSPFYPAISEEQIIVELDKLLKDSSLKGGITFKPIVTDSVEDSKKEQSSLAESSIQGIVDKYNNTTPNDEKDKSDNNKSSSNNGNNAAGNNKDSNNLPGTSNSNNKDNASANSSSTDNSKNTTKDKKDTIQYLKCEINFEGTYENLDKFMDEIDKNEKKIVINSIKMSQDTLNTLKGTIDLEIYSVPKITDELKNYLKWDFDNKYGKNVPFSSGAATGITNSDKDTSDFIASVRSTTSDLPSIMIGKTDDDLRTTYVYADSNSEESVEMTLTQEGTKYYYKYKTSNGAFPVNYNGLGAEFIPVSKNIVINILSGPRVTADDESNIKLKIVNKTDKLVEVNVTGDDAKNPRVKIDGDGNNISVNQK